METGRLTGIDLPVVELIATTRESEVVGHLGPDLCGPELPDLDEVVERLQRDRDAALATALLDQRNVAGFGNIYAIEVPFIAGVSPNQPIGAIEGLDQLVGLGTALIRTSAERGPQNTTGRRLNTADHWIYGRRGRPCPICGDDARRLGRARQPVATGVGVVPELVSESTTQRRVDAARISKLMALHPGAASFPRTVDLPRI